MSYTDMLVSRSPTSAACAGLRGTGRGSGSVGDPRSVPLRPWYKPQTVPMEESREPVLDAKSRVSPGLKGDGASGHWSWRDSHLNGVFCFRFRSRTR